MMNPSTFVGVFLTFAVLASGNEVEVEYVCTTDGGYAENGTACVSKCKSWSDTKPYVGKTTPPAEPYNNDTTTDLWCATTTRYRKNNNKKRKKWGYCNCQPKTPEPTTAPTIYTQRTLYYADGGGLLGEPQPCVFGGNVKSQTGPEKTFSSTGCEPITADYPFQDFNQKPATNTETNTGYWCPTIDRYNGQNSSPKRKSWGYCLAVNTTRSPTAFPTTATPSAAPSVFTPQSVLLADGGGVGINEVVEGDYVECQIPFTIRGGPDGDDKLYYDCVSMDFYKPYMEASTDFPQVPVNNNTDQSSWCPIVEDRYNKNAIKTPSKRKNWGFCLNGTTTRAPIPVPTSSPIITDSPTAAPTVFTPIEFVVADGGGLNNQNGSYGECQFPFTIRNGPDGDTIEYDSCVSMDYYTPYVSPDLSWNGPYEPINNQTNKMLWCPTAENKYNRNPPKTPEKKYDWAYCLIQNTTRPPTVKQGDPTMSPTTVPPTSEPTATGATFSPSTSPTTSPTSGAAKFLYHPFAALLCLIVAML